MSLDFGYVGLDSRLPNIQTLVDARILSVDTETSGVNVVLDRPYGYSLSPDGLCAYFVNMNNGFFSSLVVDDNRYKIAHNAKFDRSMFKSRSMIADNWIDTMVAAHLLEEGQLSLEALLKRRLPVDLEHHTFAEYGKTIPHSTLQELANHFGSHAVGPYMLWAALQRELRANNLWHVFWNIEMPLIPVLSDMEINGALIDTKALEELGAHYDERIDVLKDALDYYSGHYGVHGINYNSSDQMAYLLYDKIRVPKPPSYTWKDKRHPSVDKKHLEQFKCRYPIINVYLQYKAYKHLKDTYVTGILKRLVDGRIHTNFNQTRTRTGRLSSSDPNLQNIPKRSDEGRKIRRSFIAPDGSVIMKADYIQMELKKMACLANCRAMLEAFLQGRDIHVETAIRIFNDAKRRADGKTKNFQLIYGGGSEEDQEALFSAYPEIRTWTNKIQHEMEVLGYARTHHGRIEHLGNMEYMNDKEKEHLFRKGISLMDQGSCSEYTKIGMRKVWDNIRSDSSIKMLLQVHDELVFEVPYERVRDVYYLLHEAMTYNGLQIPLTVDVSVGPSWSEQSEIKLPKYVSVN